MGFDRFLLTSLHCQAQIFGKQEKNYLPRKPTRLTQSTNHATSLSALRRPACEAQLSVRVCKQITFLPGGPERKVASYACSELDMNTELFCTRQVLAQGFPE
jgi:hypothetical protein